MAGSGPRTEMFHYNPSPSLIFFPTPWFLKVSDFERWNTCRTGTYGMVSGSRCHKTTRMWLMCLKQENSKQSNCRDSEFHKHTWFKRHTAPNATASMVCIRASSRVLTSPFLLRRALPASVQNFTCLTPTETNWESESGRNSATKMRRLWPALLAILAPDKKRQQSYLS